MRQKAWPALLEANQEMKENKRLLQSATDTVSQQSLAESTQDEDTALDLIRKDVQRSSMFRCQTVTGSIVKGEQQSDHLQEKLITVIYAAVYAPAVPGKEGPCYYQGLHDVAFVLLFHLNYDEVVTVMVLRKLLRYHLMDATRKDFGNVLFLLDGILMPFLKSLDPEIYQALVEADVPVSSVILPWVVTLFAHPVQDQAVCGRLMDAFVTSHPLLPFYVAVALLLHPSFRVSILEVAHDPCMMHTVIQALPAQMKNDFEFVTAAGEECITAQIIVDAASDLMYQHPPQSLMRFVGEGLPARQHQQLLKKARNITVLGLPPSTEQPSFRVRVKYFLRTHNISKKDVFVRMELFMSRARLTYRKRKKEVTRAFEIHRNSWAVLQVLFLFVLMPQNFMHAVYHVIYTLLRGLGPRESLAVFISSLKIGMSMHAANLSDDSLANSMTETGSHCDSGGDVPLLIKSTSALSVQELGSV